MLADKRCPAGYLCPEGLTDVADAIDCEPGKYCPEGEWQYWQCGLLHQTHKEWISTYRTIVIWVFIRTEIGRIFISFPHTFLVSLLWGILWEFLIQDGSGSTLAQAYLSSLLEFQENSENHPDFSYKFMFKFSNLSEFFFLQIDNISRTTLHR